MAINNRLKNLTRKKNNLNNKSPFLIKKRITLCITSHFKNRPIKILLKLYFLVINYSILFHINFSDFLVYAVLVADSKHSVLFVTKVNKSLYKQKTYLPHKIFSGRI